MQTAKSRVKHSNLPTALTKEKANSIPTRMVMVRGMENSTASATGWKKSIEMGRTTALATANWKGKNLDCDWVKTTEMMTEMMTAWTMGWS